MRRRIRLSVHVSNANDAPIPPECSSSLPTTTRNTCYSLELKWHSQMHARLEHKQSQRFFRSYFQTIVINNTTQYPVSRAAFNRKLLTQSHLFRCELHCEWRCIMSFGFHFSLLVFLSRLFQTIKNATFFVHPVTFQRSFYWAQTTTRPMLQINCILSDK